jgi:Fe-coproporphyrin III synthase
MEAEDIDKFYLSHLVYAGRGNRYREDDAWHATTRRAMDLVFERCWDQVRQGVKREFVTGNNDADGVYFLQWVRERFPELAEHIRARLVAWGGNASGVNVANIDNLGFVHPDTFWWHYSLGNVRERPFSEIWQDTSDPIMAGLKAKPRAVKGRCGACRYFDICGGNTRVRAMQIAGDPWAEDPACYLTDHEIGVAPGPRLELTPYRKQRRAPATHDHEIAI